MCMSWYLSPVPVGPLLHGRAVHRAEELVGVGCLAGHPVADDGVHLCWRTSASMGWSALPQSTPIHLIFLALHHSANSRSGRGAGPCSGSRWPGTGLVPAKVVVAGVNDEDAALADLDPLFDHPTLPRTLSFGTSALRGGDYGLCGIDLVVAGSVGQVDDGGGAGEELVQVQGGNVLAGRVEVDLAVQVVRVGQELAVGPICPNCTIRCRFR
jgi:hypothetical protein